MKSLSFTLIATGAGSLYKEIKNVKSYRGFRAINTGANMTMYICDESPKDDDNDNNPIDLGYVTSTIGFFQSNLPLPVNVKYGLSLRVNFTGASTGRFVFYIDN